MTSQRTNNHRQTCFRVLYVSLAIACVAPALVGCGGGEPTLIVPDTSPSAQEQLQADTALLTEEIDEGR